jgi:hypothetical protein
MAMSWFGLIQARDYFTTVPNAAMSGAGMSAIANMTRGFALVSSAVVAYRTYRTGKRCGDAKL